jgi:hypothetical protein
MRRVRTHRKNENHHTARIYGIDNSCAILPAWSNIARCDPAANPGTFEGRARSIGRRFILARVGDEYVKGHRALHFQLSILNHSICDAANKRKRTKAAAQTVLECQSYWTHLTRHPRDVRFRGKQTSRFNGIPSACDPKHSPYSASASAQFVTNARDHLAELVLAGAIAADTPIGVGRSRFDQFFSTGRE